VVAERRLGEGNEEDEQERKPKKSVRDQFSKEFGTTEVVRKTTLDGNVDKKPRIIKENIDPRIAEDEAEKFPNENFIKRRESNMHVATAVLKAKNLFLKPIMAKRPQKDKLLVKTQDNPGLLKELYTRMDPSAEHQLISDITSEIEVAVKYKSGLLLVHIGRAKLLRVEPNKYLTRQPRTTAPDPFAVVEMITGPDNCDSRKTRVKRNTVDPDFQEILEFPLEERDISTAKLRVSVWDLNGSSQQEKLLGESLHELKSMDYTNGSTSWNKLYPRMDASMCGNLTIGLSFQSPRSLIVTVKEAEGIKICDEKQQTSNPYVRIKITGLPTKYETQVLHGNTSPTWNEQFEFDVHPSEFPRRVLLVNLLHKASGGGVDQQMGDVHIPLEGYQGDDIVTQYTLKDLRHLQRSNKSKWSEEGLTIEFREAMRAHIRYQYPKFIFQKKHQGKMMVSCRSLKAQTQSRILINNGIITMDSAQI